MIKGAWSVVKLILESYVKLRRVSFVTIKTLINNSAPLTAF